MIPKMFTKQFSPNLYLPSFHEPVAMIVSDLCYWLTRVELSVSFTILAHPPQVIFTLSSDQPTQTEIPGFFFLGTNRNL